MMMCGKKMCIACGLACTLVLIGALNWGLVGLGWLVGNGSNWNIVNLLLGQWMWLEAAVYILVGLAAVYKIFLYGKCCGKCGCGANCSCGPKTGTPGMPNKM